MARHEVHDHSRSITWSVDGVVCEYMFITIIFMRNNDKGYKMDLEKG